MYSIFPFVECQINLEKYYNKEVWYTDVFIVNDNLNLGGILWFTTEP